MVRSNGSSLGIFALLLLLACDPGATRAAAQSHAESRDDGAPALNPCLEQLVTWETQYNPMLWKPAERQQLSHYRVPIHLLKEGRNDRLSSYAPIRSALTETIDGVEYVRWIINPTDQSQHLKIKALLEANSLQTDLYRHLWGWPTASRSFVVVDPDTQYAFSLKMATDNAGGQWGFKPLTSAEVQAAIHTTKYLSELHQAEHPFAHLVLLDEPLGYYTGNSEHDIGLLARSLGEAAENTCSKFYLPMFVPLHDASLEEVSVAFPGSKMEFVTEHVYRDTGHAMAELLAMTGMSTIATHAQNYLIELDLGRNPTRRIVFRDYADAKIVADFAINAGKPWFVDCKRSGASCAPVGSPADNLVEGNDYHVKFSPAYQLQSFLVQAIPGRKAFKAAFAQTLSDLTGIDPDTALYSSGTNSAPAMNVRNSPERQRWLRAADAYLNRPVDARASDVERGRLLLGSGLTTRE